MTIISLTLDVEVSEPSALWACAARYLATQGEMSPETLIGSESAPRLGACLAMLLDRSEFLAGAEILQHSHDADDDADDQGEDES